MSIPSGRLCRRAAAGIAAMMLLALGGCDKGAPTPPQAASGQPVSGRTIAGAPAAARPGGDQSGTFHGFTWRLTRAKAGSPMPDSYLTGPEGDEARLAIKDGKPMLVNLWASWCAPCIAELPALEALTRRAGPRVDVAAVSLDASRADAEAFLAARGIDGLALWHDAEGVWLSEAGAGLPTTILYDGTGRERWRVVGGFDWEGTQAAALIAEGAAGRP